MAYYKRLKSGAIRGWNADKSSIPRDSLRHLDNLSDESVKAYFQNLNATAKARQLNLERLSEKTRELIEKFCRWKAGKGKHPSTVQQERHHLQIVAEYFDPQGPLALWPQKSMLLREYLKDHGYSESHINKIQGTVSRFWEYTRKHLRIVEGALDFDDPEGHAEVKDTPLKRHLTPEEVLAFVRDCPHNDMKLMALLGYFGSLRPQEIFAINRKDFVGSKEAVELQCCKVMKANGHFGAFAVYVQMQRGSRKSDIRLLKWKTVAHVAIFNKEAAKILSELLPTLEDDLPFSKHGNRYYTDKWAEHGLSLIDPKDPRRASIYWLANYGKIELVSLSLHARHKDARTTRLYYRGRERKLK